MQAVGVCGIVNKYDVSQLSVNDTKIFDINSFLGLEAMLSKEAMGDVFVLRVQVVQNHIGIAGVAGCENHDLEVY